MFLSGAETNSGPQVWGAHSITLAHSELTLPLSDLNSAEVQAYNIQHCGREGCVSLFCFGVAPGGAGERGSFWIIGVL